MILLLISFVSGVLTVLAPCILPFLPVIVGGSLTGGRINKKKALTVVVSLGLSVILFTLLLKVSAVFIAIPEYTWKLISGGIVLALGLVTLFPFLWENHFVSKLSIKSNIALGKGDQKKSFWGDVVVGASLGPIFSTCSPTYFVVLATVLPASPALGMLYLLAYTAGLCLALLFVAVVGQKIMSKIDIVADPKGIFKKGLGLIFIIVGLAVITGFDKKIETKVIESGFFDVTKIEQQLLEKKDELDSKIPEDQLFQINTVPQEEMKRLSPLEKENRFKLAPEISTPDGFINTNGEPINLKDLRGKVVLLNVWTYGCINCQRTLPYLNEWYEKYHEQGLEIIGLHTPEFSFEKELSNVEKAVSQYGIKYPVVLDNDYSTWRELQNQYWPRKYLIDLDGFIVYDYVGEGAYKETEEKITEALEERMQRGAKGDQGE
jgi:cytochrome c biogenesis protein CcdA/thiol-disulfide isomerase/thioredoxin